MHTPEDLILKASMSGATDLHLVPGLPPMARVGGTLAPVGGGPISRDDVELFLDQAGHWSGGEPLAARVVHGGRALEVCVPIPGHGRARLSAFRAAGEVRVAVRLVPDDPPAPAEIGCPRALETAFSADSGLVVVCGPTGCGKTTTLASLAQRELSLRPVHVLTVEDPVEYVLRPGPGVATQRQVGTDVESFHVAVREALRQDPDVLVVGECRDRETAEAILVAAQTGHLVATTLHASGAVDAVERLLTLLGPDPSGRNRSVLADVLLCVCYQTLLPRRTRRPGPLGTMVAAHEVISFSTVQAARPLVRDGRLHELRGLFREHRDSGMVALEDSVSTLRSVGEI